MALFYLQEYKEIPMKKLIASLTFILASFSGFAHAGDAEVYFIQPADGAVVSQEFTVVFGLKNMGVAPAGTERKNTGHHHILIDTDTLPDLTKPLPATEKIKHFGGGQTETRLSLAPGKHTLQLVLGNHLHIPHKKPVISEKITITVK